MKKVIIANCNIILNDIQERLILRYHGKGINTKDELTLELLDEFKPDFVFFLHWSWIIPSNIFNRYQCVVFHMTDLPYGRGGSPLQNLIIRGHKETMISAIRVEKGIDTGDVYLKKELSLDGRAEDIFYRAGMCMEKMIEEIYNEQIIPQKQEGDVVHFERRNPNQSLLPNDMDDIEKLYNFIRMLDAKNYPHAFMENNVFKFEFTHAELTNENEVLANVRITKK